MVIVAFLSTTLRLHLTFCSPLWQLEWIVRGPESSFEAADLSTGEWADYDGTRLVVVCCCVPVNAFNLPFAPLTDKADESVSILDIETACEAASGAGGKGKHRRRK